SRCMALSCWVFGENKYWQDIMANKYNQAVVELYRFNRVVERTTDFPWLTVLLDGRWRTLHLVKIAPIVVF
ncbi:hypothetical protein PO883_21335, partial [Massilia sp. DJPM01]|uniref:hypothetical protein n=1 Tax=Massilia sp. DJPM01 TaxID=3024404 RepID=UPI00259E5D20